MSLDPQSSFQLNVYAAVRALWNGTTDYDRFIEDMVRAIDRGYEQAWADGAAVCGLEPEDREDDEQKELQGFIVFAKEHIDSFAQEIEQGSKAVGGKLAPHLQRADLWVGKWREVYERGKIMSCGNLKEEWVVGPTEKSCPDCQKYNGRVYRNRTWSAYEIWPRMNSLSCHGFNCLCELVPTTKPITPGRPPKPTG